MKLNFEDAAVIVWLPEGEEPNEAHFDGDVDLRPPSPNPAGCWTLGEAVLRGHIDDRHGKVPWIKTGGTILSPVQALQAYEDFKTKRVSDA